MRCSKHTKKYVSGCLIFVFMVMVILSVEHPRTQVQQEELGLPILFSEDNYAIQSFFSLRIRENKKVITKKNQGQALINCPNKNPIISSSEGLADVLEGNIAEAKAQADWLLQNSQMRNGALFFPIETDTALWPYTIKAPWPSALSQGLSLGLFTYIYKATGDKSYLTLANEIYRSYYLPIEDGGFTRFDREGPFFEKYPLQEPTMVLDVDMLAIISLHDYAIIADNPAAWRMYLQSLHRLQILLPQYDIKDPRTGIGSIAYSLVPAKRQVLGRFIGNGDAMIFSIKLIGVKGNDRTYLSNVQVGGKDDDKQSNLFFILPDSKFMNWGSPITWKGEPTRRVNYQRGQYDHSPFKFSMRKTDDFDQYELEVSYVPLSGQVTLELYDGSQYWSLGDCQDNGGAKEQTVTFKISKEFLKSWDSYQPLSLSPSRIHIYDELFLINVLGSLTDSQVIKQYAQKWHDLLVLKPKAITPPVLTDIAPNPIITLLPGAQSRHDEYPSVIKINGVYIMYYCAYGDDLTWHLFEATSPDGYTWKNRKQVVIDRLPEECQGNLAFPHVINNVHSSDKNKQYLMYFSASSMKHDPYDKICWASSKDGMTWSYGGVAVADTGLDPLVVLQPDGTFVMYYTKYGDNQSSINSCRSTDGMQWSLPSTMLENSELYGLYTIGGLELDGKLVLLLEGYIMRQERHEILLATLKDQKLIIGDPIVIDDTKNIRWDSIKYGYNVFQDGNQYYVYYNGIAHLGDESGGQIGRAKLNIDVIKALLLINDGNSEV